MNHKRLKRLQLNNLPVFLTHPRVVLVDVIALHSHSPLHQWSLFEESCFHFLSVIGFKREKVSSFCFSRSFQAFKRSNADPGLICIPFAFGTFTTWGCCVATTIHQFTTRSCWKACSCIECWERSTLFTLMYYWFHCFCTSWCFSCSRNCFWICCVFAVISSSVISSCFRYLISYSMRGWSFWYKDKMIMIK